MKNSSANLERVYLDANVFIYADLASDKLGDSSRKIIEGLLERKFKGITCALTNDELMWSIWSEEGRERAIEVCRALLKMANLDIVKVGTSEIRTATDFIESYRLKPRDAIHVAAMVENNVVKMVSTDQDFDGLPDVERVDIPEFAEELRKEE